MTSDVIILIPARMASVRLPGKPLADIGGLPMIVRVARRAAQSSAGAIVVAADDAEIVSACETHGVDALLTRGDHASGSDRLAEACALLDLPGVTVEFVEGMVVENGWVSPYMVRDTERMETVFEDPLILMTNKPISHPSDLLPALDQLMKDPRPLVILAEKVDGGALGMLVANNQHRTIEAVAARAPGFGHRRIQHLGDLAAFAAVGTVAIRVCRYGAPPRRISSPRRCSSAETVTASAGSPRP